MFKKIINKWDKYNRLMIVYELPQRGYNRYFLCKCDCWKEKEIRIDHLKNGRTKSCGCFNKEILNNRKTHWLSNHKIYRIYDWINERCNNKNSSSYNNYWNRWIKCEWDTFEEFYRDMWETYQEWLQIDRINNDWNYSKNNCKWSTRKQNCRNRRNTIYVWDISLPEYCEINNLNYSNSRRKYKLWTLI